MTKDSRPNNRKKTAAERALEKRARLADKASDHDREWFENNPGTDQYFRPLMRGEFWPHKFPPGTMVVVQKIAPGVRIRQPNNSPMGLYPGSDAKLVDQVLSEQMPVTPDDLARLRDFMNDSEGPDND